MWSTGDHACAELAQTLESMVTQLLSSREPALTMARSGASSTLLTDWQPQVAVFGYDNIEQATDYVRSKGKPLALYVFSEDQAFIDNVLSNTSSGGVTVNNWFVHCAEPNLPFGGVNESGQGSYHGLHGFKELSHQRAVFVDQTT